MESETRIYAQRPKEEEKSSNHDDVSPGGSGDRDRTICLWVFAPPPVFSSAGCDIEISRVVITQFCNTLNGLAAEGR